MKKSKVIVPCLLVFVLVMGMLSGCGRTTPVATPAPTEQKAPVEQTAKLHEIYTMTNRVALSAVESPIWEDRSKVNKALPKEKKQKITIGWTEFTLGTPFFVAMVESAKATAAKLGYELKVQVADGSLEKQSAQFDAFVSMGVDVIVVDAVDIKAAGADVKRAVAAGIPVVGVGPAFDKDVPVITTIEQNSFYSGWTSGLVVGDTFKDKPIKAAVVLGKMGHPIAESRINGMISGILYKRYEQMGRPFKSKEDAILAGTKLEQELIKNGKVKSDELKLEIVSALEGVWSVEGGLKATEDILTAHPDINLMLAENDQMGMGAVKAIEQSGLVLGKDVQIASCGDGTKEAMELIKSGKYLVDGYYSPTLTGEAVINLLYKIFTEGYDANNMPYVTDIPLVAITKDNVDQHYDPNNAFAKPLPFVYKTIDQLNKEQK